MKYSFEKVSFFFVITIILLVSCSTPTIENTEVSDSDQQYLEPLIVLYNEYCSLHHKLTLDGTTGEEIRDIYYRSKEIVAEINAMIIPSKFEELKDNLATGIDKQSDGFGCFSNESLCSGNLEATTLTFEGKKHLDLFIEEFRVYDEMLSSLFVE